MLVGYIIGTASLAPEPIEAGQRARKGTEY